MSNHTPGPWEVEAEAGFGVFVHDPDGTVAEVMCDQKHTDDYTALANAYLIAAAPEMLEALKHMLLVCENYDFDGCDFEYWAGPDALPIVRAAIAKAEGQQ